MPISLLIIYTFTLLFCLSKCLARIFNNLGEAPERVGYDAWISIGLFNPYRLNKNTSTIIDLIERPNEIDNLHNNHL